MGSRERNLDRLRRAGRILLGATRNFDRDGCFDQAAVISYFALLSILPLCILLVAFGAAVLGSADAAERGVKLLLRDLAMRLGPEVFAQARAVGTEASRYGWPFLVLALWTASKVFSKVEAALDRVFRVAARRSYPLRKIFAFGLVAVLAVSLLVLLVLTGVVATLDRLLESSGLTTAARSNPLYVAVDNAASRYLIPWLLSVVTFTFIYRVVPACFVFWRAAGVAGLVAGSLWEGIKNAFTWYLSHVANYARTYGALETVVIFIIWVNLSSILLLWGAELAAILTGARSVSGGDSSQADSSL